MFKDCNMYCLKGFISNMYPFLKVTNYTNLDIYFILQYTLPKETKTSTIHYKKIEFSSNAKDIAFNVLSSPMHKFICNHSLAMPGYYNFNVVETACGIKCEQG